MQDKIDTAKVVLMYIGIGAMSGIIQISEKEHKNKTRFEKFCVWLTSFCFAVFVTPTFVWLIEINVGLIIPENVKYGICFFSAQFGEKTLRVAMRVYRNVDWKTLIITALNSKNKK